MRQIRLKKGFLVDSAWCNEGDVVEVDDYRAAKLVEIGHAENVAQVAVSVVQPQRATAPKAPENAKALK